MRLRRIAFFVSVSAAALACGWDPSRPFDREAPQVNEALKDYDAGDAGSAANGLEDYLTTGGCKEGNIGTPLRLHERANGTFDLGLALFKIAEAYGKRFGEEEIDGGTADPQAASIRGGTVDCALRIVRAIAEDPSQPLPLRARARYLEGNLLFLTAAYKESVTAYDAVLEILPGMGDAGPIGLGDAGKVTFTADATGRDAAWNRAVALRRIEDKKDAGEDASPPDAGGDSGDSGNKKDGGEDNKDAGKDSGSDSGSDDKNKDAGKDSGSDDKDKKDPPKPKDEPEAGAPPPPSRQNQDDRILDQLENAPTVQQEAAKKQHKRKPVTGASDK